MNCFFYVFFEGLLFLFEHGIHNGFHLFYHDEVQSPGFFQLIESGGDIVEGVKIDDFMEMLEDELDDISEWVDFGFLIMRDELLWVAVRCLVNQSLCL